MHKRSVVANWLQKPANLVGPTGANLIVAQGVILTTTPNRSTEANNDIENPVAKIGGTVD
ncbi:hypothetical protein LMG28727_06265 [Paraburkholderia kirstenboschensis]|nr:hypothetical protein LMG28727_06265 [Paraburkholderia kirstenboschensis]